MFSVRLARLQQSINEKRLVDTQGTAWHHAGLFLKNRFDKK